MEFHKFLLLFFNYALFLVLTASFLAINGSQASRVNPFQPGILMPTDEQAQTEAEDDELGTRWAVLVAGSNGYGNYRHQADVCHAYQLLRKGGLKEENIIVFMYDDIANSELNPRPGVIINSPNGDDVYAGVPKVKLNITSWGAIIFDCD